MLILSYPDQLSMLASEERVELLDAVKHAGVPTSTYYRSLNGTVQMRQATAETIARAIKDISAR